MIEHGFNPQVGEDPYAFLVYTSFQEAATQVSHRNTATLTRRQGAIDLAKLNAKIAGDEGRHKRLYVDVMSEVFRQDPEGGIMALRHMLGRSIVMPAARMTDGEPFPQGASQSERFTQFADVAQSLGVYTTADYLAIMNELRSTWDIDNLSVLGSAAKAQDQIGKIAYITERRAEQTIEEAKIRARKHTFPWLNANTA